MKVYWPDKNIEISSIGRNSLSCQIKNYSILYSEGYKGAKEISEKILFSF